MEVELEKLRAAFDLLDHVPADDSDTSKMVRVSVRKTGGLGLALAGLVAGSAGCSGKGKDPEARLHIDRRYLRAFLSTAGADKITVKMDEQALHLVSDCQKARLAAVAVDGKYPHWKGDGKAINLPEWLRADLPCLVQFSQRLPGAEYFELTQAVGGFGVLATDSLALMGCLDPALKLTVALPRLFVEVACKIPEAALFADEQVLVLKSEAGYLMQPLCAAAETYPFKDLQGLLNRALKAGTLLRVKAQTLADELKQVGLLSTAGPQTIVQLKTAAKGRSLLTSVTEQATVERSLACAGKGEYDATWVAGPVITFANHLAGLDPDCTIDGGRLEHTSFFRAMVEKRTYLLLLIDRA